MNSDRDFLYYAAYGSNLHPTRLRDRVPSAELAATRPISGWTLRFHKRSNVDGSAKCSIATADDRVHFAIYRMSGGDRQRLDEAEGLGLGYNEATIDVPGIGPCFTYIAAASHIDDSLQPLDWYREMVALGCEFHGFPPDYIDSVRSLHAVPDPDESRRRQQWAIVDRLHDSI